MNRAQARAQWAVEEGKNASAVLLIILAAVLVAVMGCEQEPTMPSTIKVGDAIEGNYVVRDYSTGIVIGHLNMVSGKYSFMAEENVNFPAENFEGFFFWEYPQGVYSVEYEDGVDEDMLLQYLEGKIYVAIASFVAAPVDARENVVYNHEQLYRSIVVGHLIDISHTRRGMSLSCSSLIVAGALYP